MSGLRIRHLMIVIAAAALLFAVVRADSSCCPLSPLLALAYLCGGLGMIGARRRGRRTRAGFWLGPILGPLGVLVASSHPIEPHELRFRDDPPAT